MPPAAVISRLPSKRGRDDGRDRDPLRAAIARRAEAADAITRHRDAISRARQLVTAAERKAERSARAISEAKSEHARLMADAIVSGDDDVAGGTGIVRAA